MCRKGDYSNSSVPREWRREELGFQLEKPWQLPSAEKLHILAAYLGVTTSELLGEEDPHGEGPTQPYLVMRYNSLSPASQDKLMTFLEYLVAEESKKNGVRIGHTKGLILIKEVDYGFSRQLV